MISKINKVTSEDAMIRQIGEEASELTHAVFKLLRTLGCESPTPISPETAMLNLLEEIADVNICVLVFLANKPSERKIIEKIKHDKLNRWYDRLKKERSTKNVKTKL